MKKHVVWFNFIPKDRASDAFLYVMNFCMKTKIKFVATYEKSKGRLEFECDQELWERMITGCLVFTDYNIPLEDESL